MGGERAAEHGKATVTKVVGEINNTGSVEVLPFF